MLHARAILNTRVTKRSLLMNKIDLPDRTTKENASDIIEIGSHILDVEQKWKRFLFSWKVSLDFLLRWALAGCLLYLFFAPFFWGLILPEYLHVDLAELPRNIFWFLMVYTALAMIFANYLGIWKGKRDSNWIIYKALKPIKPEHEVFNEFSVLSRNLLEGNRRRTVKRLSYLREKLGKYLEVNSDLKKYLVQELTIFKDTISLGRLILYSEETELSYYFLDLGLSFYHQNFSLLYSKIEELKSHMMKFEIKQPTTFERLVNFVKMAEHIKNLVLVIVVIISFILWIIYGVKFTSPSG